jgi:hypothetical protein
MLHALSLALLTSLCQSGPTHAGFHPAAPDIYVEMGDVGALLTALEQSPAMRFARDERMKAVWEAAGMSPEQSLRDLAKAGVLSALPEANPGAWMDGLKTISASFSVLGPADSADGEAFLAVADLATAEQARALHAAILARAPKHEPLSSSVPGVELLRFGDKPTDALWCVALETRLIAGGGALKPEDFVARLEKQQPALSSNERFQKQLAALESAKGTTVLWFALGRSLSEMLAMRPEDKGAADFLAQLPADLNPLASPRVARMQLVGERFVTEMVSADTGAAAERKLDPAWLEPVPASSMVVYSAPFDGAGAAQRLRALLAKDEQRAATLAALEQRLGFGPEKLLARLGPGMTVYAAAPAGLGLPETRVWIDCDDAAAFTQECEALLGALGETLPGFAVKTKPYKLKKAGTEEKLEVPITTLTLPPDAIQLPMISVAPSFAPVGKKLVFALNSMDVKNELKRVHSGEGEPIVAGANTLAARGFVLPAEARSAFVMDWAGLFSGLLGTVKAFAGMAPPDQLPMDLSKLPPPEIFAQYFKPTFHYARAIAGGTYRRNEASFGPETWFGLAGIGAAAARAQQAAFAPAGAGAMGGQ